MATITAGPSAAAHAKGNHADGAHVNAPWSDVTPSNPPNRTRSNLSPTTAAPTTESIATSVTTDDGTGPADMNAGTDDSAHGKLLLLFDSSGSMEEPDDDGGTKIEAARQAFRDLIPRLPDDALVGLRVYGATVYDPSDPRACTDTQLVVPVGRVDRPALTQALASFRPYGETPIAYSLRQAAKDLGTSGRRTILLVSDGEETCDPDPCATAREITGLGIEVKIDVVGYRVDPEARKQLRCIADAGSGTFYEADDANDLAVSLHRLSVRAFRPFRVAGRPVSGTSTVDSAPVLRAGQYVDTAPRQGETRYYRLRRSMDSSTLYIGASARPAPSQAIAAIHLDLRTPDGDGCGYGLGTGVSYARTNPVVTASVSSWDPFTAHHRDCQRGRELVLALRQSGSTGAADHASRRSGSQSTLDGVPIEIVILEEPPVASRDDLPPPAPIRPPWRGPTGEAATEVTPGASFSDAPLVGPGRYRTSLFPGEVQFVRVRLDWGQRLEAEVRVPRPPAKVAGLLDAPHLLDLTLIGPTRGEAVATLSEVAGQDHVLLSPTTSSHARATTVEVRYANRDAGGAPQTSTVIPGDYVVAVGLGDDRDGETYLLPIEILIGIEGRGGDGAPPYVDDLGILVPGPDGAATTFRPHSTGDPTGSDDETSGSDSGAGPRGNVLDGDPLVNQRTGAPRGQLSGPRAVLVGVLSAVVAVLFAATGVSSWRRRRVNRRDAELTSS
jgi:Ca-activated chloride channel family protein